MAEAEAAGQIVAESGDRKRKEVVPMNLSKGRDRDYHDERETTKRNKAAAKSMKDELEELRKAIANGVSTGDTGAEEEDAKEEEAAVDVLSLVARHIQKAWGDGRDWCRDAGFHRSGFVQRIRRQRDACSD